jgi:hypothetical protein
MTIGWPGALTGRVVGQELDQGAMLWKKGDERPTVSQFKILQVKGGIHGASNKGIRIRSVDQCSKPAPGRHEYLEGLPTIRVRAEFPLDLCPILVDHVNGEGTSLVEMPEFVRFDSVKSRHLTAFQEVNDGRAQGTGSMKPLWQTLRWKHMWRSVSPPVEPPFRMLPEVEVSDEFFNSSSHRAPFGCCKRVEKSISNVYHKALKTTVPSQ